MASACAITGSLVNMRNVGTHKSVALTIHVPEELAHKVIEAFGWPTAASPVAVALARLQTAKSEPEVTKPHRRMNELPLPQQAGILCGDERFAKFVKERFDHDDPIEFVRTHCSVSSRSLIKPGSFAAQQFYQIQGLFDVWKTGEYA